MYERLLSIIAERTGATVIQSEAGEVNATNRRVHEAVSRP